MGTLEMNGGGLHSPPETADRQAKEDVEMAADRVHNSTVSATLVHLLIHIRFSGGFTRYARPLRQPPGRGEGASGGP